MKKIEDELVFSLMDTVYLIANGFDWSQILYEAKKSICKKVSTYCDWIPSHVKLITFRFGKLRGTMTIRFFPKINVKTFCIDYTNRKEVDLIEQFLTGTS